MVWYGTGAPSGANNSEVLNELAKIIAVAGLSPDVVPNGQTFYDGTFYENPTPSNIAIPTPLSTQALLDAGMVPVDRSGTGTGTGITQSQLNAVAEEANAAREALEAAMNAEQNEQDSEIAAALQRLTDAQNALSQLNEGNSTDEERNAAITLVNEAQSAQDQALADQAAILGELQANLDATEQALANAVSASSTDAERNLLAQVLRQEFNEKLAQLDPGTQIGNVPGYVTSDNPVTSPTGNAGDYFVVLDDTTVDGVQIEANTALKLNKPGGGAATYWDIDPILTATLQQPSDLLPANATIVTTDDVVAVAGGIYYVIAPTVAAGYRGPADPEGNAIFSRRLKFPAPVDGQAPITVVVHEVETDFPVHIDGNTNGDSDGRYQYWCNRVVKWFAYNNTWNPVYTQDGRDGKDGVSGGGGFGEVTTEQLNQAKQEASDARSALVAAQQINDGVQNAELESVQADIDRAETAHEELIASNATDQELSDAVAEINAAKASRDLIVNDAQTAQDEIIAKLTSDISAAEAAHEELIASNATDQELSDAIAEINAAKASRDTVVNDAQIAQDELITKLTNDLDAAEQAHEELLSTVSTDAERLALANALRAEWSQDISNAMSGMSSGGVTQSQLDAVAQNAVEARDAIIAAQATSQATQDQAIANTQAELDEAESALTSLASTSATEQELLDALAAINTAQAAQDQALADTQATQDAALAQTQTDIDEANQAHADLVSNNATDEELAEAVAAINASQEAQNQSIATSQAIRDEAIADTQSALNTANETLATLVEDSVTDQELSDAISLVNTARDARTLAVNDAQAAQDALITQLTEDLNAAETAHANLVAAVATDEELSDLANLLRDERNVLFDEFKESSENENAEDRRVDVLQEQVAWLNNQSLKPESVAVGVRFATPQNNANMPMTRPISYRFVAERSLALKTFVHWWRYNTPATINERGYSFGNGGEYLIELVEDEGGRPTGRVIASATHAPDIVNNPNQAVNGVTSAEAQGNVFRKLELQPQTESLIQGNAYHVRVTNIHPEPNDNFVSANGPYYRDTYQNFKKASPGLHSNEILVELNGEWIPYFNSIPATIIYLPFWGVEYADTSWTGSDFLYGNSQLGPNAVNGVAQSHYTITGDKRVRQRFTLLEHELLSDTYVHIFARKIKGYDPLEMWVDGVKQDNLHITKINETDRLDLTGVDGDWYRLTCPRLEKDQEYLFEFSTTEDSEYYIFGCMRTLPGAIVHTGKWAGKAEQSSDGGSTWNGWTYANNPNHDSANLNFHVSGKRVESLSLDRLSALLTSAVESGDLDADTGPQSLDEVLVDKVILHDLNASLAGQLATSGSAITSWPNSGLGSDFVKSGNEPLSFKGPDSLFGAPTIDMSQGNGGSMTTTLPETSSQPVTVIITYAALDFTNLHRMFINLGGPSFTMFFNSGKIVANGGLSYADPNPADDAPHVAIIEYNGTDSAFTLDGITTTGLSLGTSGVKNLLLGGQNAALRRSKMRLARFTIVEGTLTPSERTNITLLSQKYIDGVVVEVPEGTVDAEGTARGTELTALIDNLYPPSLSAAGTDLTVVNVGSTPNGEVAFFKRGTATDNTTPFWREI